MPYADCTDYKENQDDETRAGLEVVADDVGAKEDVPAWANRTGNKLLEMREENGVLYFLIEKS